MKKIFSLLVLFLLITFQVNAANRVILGPQYFPDSDIGRPISNGSIYVGLPDTDPTVVGNQIQLYVLQEDGDLVAISQPVTTNSGGVPEYNGDPISLYVDNEEYSLTVLDKNDAQEYYVPNNKQDSDDGATYEPDYTEADQGVTGNSTTVKYYVDLIGTTNKATIKFLHNSGNEWTDYNFSTSETIPSNIALEFENGAILIDDSSNADLTVNGGIDAGASGLMFDWSNGSGDLEISTSDNIIAGQSQQIFADGSDVIFTTEGVAIFAGWWGDDDIQSAIDSLGSDGTTPIILSAIDYDIGSTSINIDHDGVSLIGVFSSHTTSSASVAPTNSVPETTITYSGTGSGSMAINIDNNTTSYIYDVTIKNMRLFLDADTETGLFANNFATGTIENVFPYGQNNDSGNNGDGTGIKVLGALGSEIINCETKGNGNGASTYCPYGLYVDDSDERGTTTLTTYNCRWRQCQTGAFVECNTFTSQTDVYESNTVTGVEFFESNGVTLNAPHFENNPHCIDNTDSFVDVFGGQIKIPNSGDGYFIGGSTTNNGDGIIFHGSFFLVSTVSTPYIFDLSSTFEAGVFGFYGCTFSHVGSSSSYLMGGSTDSVLYDFCPVNSMQMTNYRYKQLSVAADETYGAADPFPPDDTDMANSIYYYLMPLPGHIVGLNAYFSTDITAGQITFSIISEGATKLGVIMDSTDGSRFIHRGKIFNTTNSSIAQGEYLQCRAITDAAFLPDGTDDMTVDVVVMHGNDGWYDGS